MYTQYTLYTGGVYCVYSAISRLSADTGVSSDVQNDLIACLDDIIQGEIDKEISECQFISIQCEET